MSQSKPLKFVLKKHLEKWRKNAAQLFREKQNSNFPFCPPANVPFNYVILGEDCWGPGPRELALSIIIPKGVGPTISSLRHCLKGWVPSAPQNLGIVTREPDFVLTNL